MRGVSILGATGSIGRSTLDVIGRHPDKYRVVAMSAHSDVEGMAALCQRFRPKLVGMGRIEKAEQLRNALQERGLSKITVVAGPEGLCQVATHERAELVMAAIVGSAGLLPSLAAVEAKKTLLLANKESLVMAGRLFMRAVEEHGVKVLPIDSEHNAIFQCLPADFDGNLQQQGIVRILLTASGGPFRAWPAERLASVTPAQACNHPNWNMGQKISVDSATLMNKGLELIEAHWLFGAAAEQIQVVVHPQSVIHSMVEYADGSILAQMGNPDMRTPIAHALAWPNRIRSGVERLNLFEVARLDFEPPDLQRFPCLRLAYQAIEAEGSAPAVLNAANEIAVAAFLQGRIGFTRIPQIIEATLDSLPLDDVQSLDELLEVDARARQVAKQMLIS